MAIFTGVGVALVTRFSEDGALDAPASAELAAQLVGLGVRAVVVAGSTGEAAALEPDERTELLDAVRAAVGGAVPVIAGTVAPSARQAARLTVAAREHGADAVLALSPPGSGDPRPYYDAVAKAAGDVPVLAYHFPAMSSPGIAVEQLRDLPVVGCKDSSGDVDRLLRERTEWEGELYTGSAAILAIAGPVGCTGAILALANAAPELCVRAFDGDAGAQLELVPVHRRAQTSFPSGIKQLVAERFGGLSTARVG
jgi:4-hydroxy-tetrahydrodipicolinate synthase